MSLSQTYSTSSIKTKVPHGRRVKEATGGNCNYRGILSKEDISKMYGKVQGPQCSKEDLDIIERMLRENRTFCQIKRAVSCKPAEVKKAIMLFRAFMNK